MATPAKVYLANLYELGIHYKPDPSKADVWYRNAARSAVITAEAAASASGWAGQRRALAAFGRALVPGCIAGAAGAFLWGFPRTTLLEPRAVQVMAFGAAGFLAGLLVLGILGGAKSGQYKRRPR